MAQDNIALVQSLYAAFGRGDIATIVSAAAPDIRWEVAGRQADYPAMGVRHGRPGVQEFFKVIAEIQDASEFSPKEFHASGDKVFVLGHYVWTVRKTGRKAESDWIHIFTIRDGKVVSFHEFTDTAQFAEAYRG